MATKRLRIIAGPNGSGKSSLFPRIRTQVSTGHYLNADDILLGFQNHGVLDLADYALEPRSEDLRHYLHRQRSFVRKAEGSGEHITLTIKDHHLCVTPGECGGYTAALASGFLREQLVLSGQTFSFESVLSDPSKLEEIEFAKACGFRIYLYFVCTVDPDINVARVANRVCLGGHRVPEARIRERYRRTLENLYPALLLCDRAYLFDNSGESMDLVLESDGKACRMHSEYLPSWVEDYLITPLNMMVEKIKI